ncbi:MAG: DUF2095 family protein [Candidatus Hodarchaeota archaeon]
MVSLDPEKEKKKTPQKEKPPEFLGMTQNITIDNIQEHFPAIYEEFSEKKMSLGISEVKSGLGLLTKEQENNVDPLSDYEPNVFDFLTRATTEEEGYEIINFLAKQKQISPKTAQELKAQIESSGIRSFGPLRTNNHYFRKAAEIQNRRIMKKRHTIPINEEAKE